MKVLRRKSLTQGGWGWCGAEGVGAPQLVGEGAGPAANAWAGWDGRQECRWLLGQGGLDRQVGAGGRTKDVGVCSEDQRSSAGCQGGLVRQQTGRFGQRLGERAALTYMT